MGFITSNPVVSAMDQAQQAYTREQENAARRLRLDQEIEQAQAAKEQGRVLGDIAIQKLDAAQKPAISNVVSTVAPPQSIANPVAPQMSHVPQSQASQSQINNVMAKPQMSEWTQPVQVESQVSTPGRVIPGAEGIRRLATTPGGGRAAYDMVSASEKEDQSRRATLYKALHDAQTPADMDIAIKQANELGAGIPEDLLKQKRYALALKQAGTVAHLLGNKDQAFKAVLSASMNGGDVNAVIQQLASGGGQNIKWYDSMRGAGITEDGRAVPIGGLPGRQVSGKGGGGGRGGGESKGAKFDVDQDGNRVILYRDGTMVYPKDANGNVVKIRAGTDEDQKFQRKLVEGSERNRMPETGEDPVTRAQELTARTRKEGTPAATAQNSPLPQGIPQGAKQIGTKGGKPVYEWTDASGRHRAVLE
ncbi:MAG: hypothetical protein EG825_00465 [Rhodocyclaceae bacterium]|nr:hypothetical protein [Rhodocyclaceae bacterium]